jgi:type IV secretion system protein TrbJ
LAQKQFNDDWATSVAQHQQLLQQDAANLQRAQSSAQSADSMLAEMQANAQINAAMANQLMEIHALLVQEQQALQARQASQANEDAMRQAATERYLHWNYQPAQKISY